MITEKDVKILCHLRKDARKKVTEISRTTMMPATTIYDRLKVHRRTGIVKRHTALLDFRKLGYNATAMVALKVSNDHREQLREYLQNHPNINSLYRVNTEHDFLAEVVFENLSKLQEFLDDTASRFQLQNTKVFNIVDEMKKEEFMSR
jgi:Lrp/AsnC family transcriptional regulator for asnA, asnC and gidA